MACFEIDPLTGERLGEVHDIGLGSGGPAPEAPPARESRLAPTVSVTVGDDSVYAGSMNAVTGEGYDPCHDAELGGLNSAESIVPVHPAGDVPSLPFGWTGSDMVRGIVVSEILNRKKGCRR